VSIEVGDSVKIEFSGRPPIRGVVTYVPAATGDAWHISTNDGLEVYVQQFEVMIKLGAQ